jgi:hypothetical protein
MLAARLRARAPELAAAAAALVVLGVGLGEIPGFHGDEAWIFTSVKAIAAGARPLDGMNSYTGALYLYPLWPLFESMGYRLELLRAVAALTAAATAALIVAAARLPLFGGASPAWVAALLISSPAFVAFSRFASEVTVLLPLLVVGGLLSIARAMEAAGARRAARAGLGGALLGLATYTHVIAVAAPAAAGLAFLLCAPRRALREPALRLAAAGFAFGFAPRWLPLLAGSGAGSWSYRLAKVASGRFARDFGSLPGVLAGGLDGGLVYQRYVGGSWIPVLPYASAALLLLIALRGLQRGDAGPGRRELALGLFVVLLADLLVVISSGLSLRYFLMNLYFAPLLLAALAAPLLAAGAPTARRIARATLAAVVALNVFYVGTNYFFAFSRTGGASSVFPIGKRLLETSNHFMRSDRLYAQLVERGIETVLAKDFIALPLRAYDLERGLLRTLEFPPSQPPPLAPLLEGRRVAVVYYNGPEVYRRRAWDLRGRERIQVGPVSLRRDPGFDPNFLVFVPEPAAGGLSAGSARSGSRSDPR